MRVTFVFLLQPNVNIGAIVTQRLSAIRKLQENPYDVEALGEMHKSQKEVKIFEVSFIKMLVKFFRFRCKAGQKVNYNLDNLLDRREQIYCLKRN